MTGTYVPRVPRVPPLSQCSPLTCPLSLFMLHPSSPWPPCSAFLVPGAQGHLRLCHRGVTGGGGGSQPLDLDPWGKDKDRAVGASGDPNLAPTRTLPSTKCYLQSSGAGRMFPIPSPGVPITLPGGTLSVRHPPLFPYRAPAALRCPLWQQKTPIQAQPQPMLCVGFFHPSLSLLVTCTSARRLSAWSGWEYSPSFLMQGSVSYLSRNNSSIFGPSLLDVKHLAPFLERKLEATVMATMGGCGDGLVGAGSI